MANKASSKGRQKKQLVKKAGISPAGPKQTFSRVGGARRNISGPRRFKTCPITVCVVPFHESVFNAQLIEFVSKLIVTESDSCRGMHVRTGHLAGQPKKRMQLIVPNHRDELQLVLDAAKTADVILCVFPSEATYEQSCFDSVGYETLTALRMQGLAPMVMGSVIDPSGGSKLGIKTVQRYFFSEFSADKSKFITPSANVRDIEGLARQVATTIVTSGGTSSDSLALRRMRGYMLIDACADRTGSEIVISGYARGAGFGLKSLVHLTGCPETFMVKKVEVEGIELARRDSELEAQRLDLEPLRPAEMQEQTWPTEEEEMEAEKNIFARRMKRVAVPAGADSEMEAAWLGEDVIGEDALFAISEEPDKDEELLEGMFDWDQLGDMKPDEEPEARFEGRSREDMDFPDEVDTPESMSARERFQKYRGLKSLRSGNWDAYEELPVEFSQIHEFQDMQWASKQSFAHLNDCENVRDQYVRLTLVSQSGRYPDLSFEPLVASTIAPFETKVTVIHCRVARLPEASDLRILNKDTVTVQAGFRRFEVRPTFSEIPKYSSATGTAPLQRMYRQLPENGSNILMSFYAPAMFGSHSVLAFHSGRLVLWGSLATCAPNKPVIVKRSTLTGYPFRVHQTKAVCRFMFFDPADIEWFKPVELATKKGLRGHIIESLGTHGYMKCRFNGQLTSDDILCMHLYKRVFPKWHPRAWSLE
jgi:pre-rRNA-processing protein TSR1